MTLYAARLNAFRIGAERYWPGKNRITAMDLVDRAATVEGLAAADLNYPDHFADADPAAMARHLDRAGLALNGLAMRYYTDPGFKLGAFTHPDPATRHAAIDLTKRGLDALAEMGGRLMTLWMGQDGVDYAFQADYARMWAETIDAMTEIADHNPALDIAIEYKPDEPRAFALMPDMATTLLALDEIDRPNTGVTLDFAHMLYAGEIPAMAAMHAARRSRILGLHLNDGYGKRDDGLMVGSVHPVQTVELLVTMTRLGYGGAIYFDTFPDQGGLDPVEEARTNVLSVDRLRRVATRLADDPALIDAMQRQDAAISTRIVQAALHDG
ncbi:MAG: TIM barrel protein [Pseudomonadota bacterium]